MTGQPCADMLLAANEAGVTWAQLLHCDDSVTKWKAQYNGLVEFADPGTDQLSGRPNANLRLPLEKPIGPGRPSKGRIKAASEQFKKKKRKKAKVTVDFKSPDLE